MISLTIGYLVVGALLTLVASVSPGRFAVEVEIFGRTISRRAVLITLIVVMVLVWPVVLWMVLAGKTGVVVEQKPPA